MPRVVTPVYVPEVLQDRRRLGETENLMEGGGGLVVKRLPEDWTREHWVLCITTRSCYTEHLIYVCYTEHQLLTDEDTGADGGGRFIQSNRSERGPRGRPRYASVESEDSST